MVNKLNKLTWQYFIESKIKEIALTILIISVIVFIPYLLGHSIGDNKDAMCSDMIYTGTEEGDCSNFEQWVEGFFYIFIIAVVSLSIYKWLSSNWENAKAKAKKELRK